MKSPNLATIYRVFFFLPVVLPSAVVYYVWKWMYDASYGVFNHLLIDILHLPLQPIGWLTNPDVALKSLVLMSTWELMGTTLMMFLVGLNSISREVYEAARIDGASEWESMRCITLPLLKPVLLVIIVIRLRVLGVVVEPLVMTMGDPIRSTMTYGLHAYFTSFQRQQNNRERLRLRGAHAGGVGVHLSILLDHLRGHSPHHGDLQNPYHDPA